LAGITAGENRILTLPDRDTILAGTTGSLTQGSVPFIDANGDLTENNSQLF